MSTSPLIPQNSHILPTRVFEQISLALQAVATDTGEPVTIFTEAILPNPRLLLQHGIRRFLVVLSARFSGLLVGTLIDAEAGYKLVANTSTENSGITHSPWEYYQTSISFDPQAIAVFLDSLQQACQADASTAQQVAAALQLLQPNDSHLQSQFTLQLAELMAYPNNFLTGSHCPIELPTVEAEQQQIEQDKVFSQVANQIRQTQELSQILKMVVQQVCSFLQADRVVIYEFEPSLLNAEVWTETLNAKAAQTLPENQLRSFIGGRISYEARMNPSVPQILNLSEGMQCFVGVADYKEKYRKGSIQAVNDIRKTYNDAPCLMNLLEWAKVRAKLVVPIVVQDRLWGLLIAHQCTEARSWLDSEIRFLQCIAELVAIAIYQTQLYAQLQQQTQNLEQRVIARTQELRDALQASQAASLAKTEFLASVSHELRTPLTAIIGMATTLLRLPQNPNYERILSLEKQQDYLKIIRNSGEHLLELINDILDLSQVEAGRAILEMQEFSIHQVVNESLQMLRHKAQRNGITLQVDLQTLLPNPDETGTAPDRLIADARRIKQILLNLLSNAIKFTPEGGTVTLRVWREHDFVVLQVQDTGIGIPESQFPLLFKKFQQLDTTYHRQYEGTGLGLALTKQLVDLHGGRVEVESAVNQGSVFTVWIPAQPPSLRVKSTVPAYEPMRQTVAGRIVLVEREEATANLICDLLTSAGHQVIWMIDGMTALQQIEFVKPDVVVINTHLNRISAAEFLRCLRQNAVTETTKVLTLADPTTAPSDRGLVEGADDSVDIPLSYPEILITKVATLLEQARTPKDELA